MTYTMKEACNQTGLSYDTLKFYCNEGLVPFVRRDKNNYRIFSNDDIAWIKSLSCLKNCGMSIVEMKEYLDLCFKAKLKELQNKVNEIEESIKYIHWKQKFYEDVLSGKTKYYTNLKPYKND